MRMNKSGRRMAGSYDFQRRAAMVGSSVLLPLTHHLLHAATAKRYSCMLSVGATCAGSGLLIEQAHSFAPLCA